VKLHGCQRVGTKKELARIAPGRCKLSELPDEVKDSKVWAAFGAEGADPARADHHGDGQQTSHQLVSCFLQRVTVHLAEAVEAEPQATADLRDAKRWG